MEWFNSWILYDKLSTLESYDASIELDFEHPFASMYRDKRINKINLKMYKENIKLWPTETDILNEGFLENNQEESTRKYDSQFEISSEELSSEILYEPMCSDRNIVISALLNRLEHFMDHNEINKLLDLNANKCDNETKNVQPSSNNIDCSIKSDIITPKLMYESLLNEQQTLTNYLVEMLAKYICVDEIERILNTNECDQKNIIGYVYRENQGNIDNIQNQDELIYCNGIHRSMKNLECCTQLDNADDQNSYNSYYDEDIKTIYTSIASFFNRIGQFLMAYKELETTNNIHDWRPLYIKDSQERLIRDQDICNINLHLRKINATLKRENVYF